MTHLLTLPDSEHQPLSIRAKALVFHDPSSKALLEQAERVAASDANVLIIGETGTGKELIARHVHNKSGRTGPFVAINCGAFTENLVEAELFGHEAGAYTGASGSRAGWFEAANHGTLFLDEVGDLPLPTQVKLLRVLQERQVVRLGSRKPINVNVRLVAATNVELELAVAAGHFRADLYYRLNVALLHLLPLAKRPDDILALADHFVSLYRQRLKLPHVRLGVDAKEALLDYSWPGNIRELENVIHYALIINSTGVVAASDLRLRGVSGPQGHGGHGGRSDLSDTSPASAAPRGGHTAMGSRSAWSTAGFTPTPWGEPSLDRLANVFVQLFEEGGPNVHERIEQVLIDSAYAYCQRNQVHTADMLGISRNVLRTQLKRFGHISGGQVPHTPLTPLTPHKHHDTTDSPRLSP